MSSSSLFILLFFNPRLQGDELETILQSITDSDATLPQISDTRTWSSLPLSSSAGASTNVCHDLITSDVF